MFRLKPSDTISYHRGCRGDTWLHDTRHASGSGVAGRSRWAGRGTLPSDLARLSNYLRGHNSVSCGTRARWRRPGTPTLSPGLASPSDERLPAGRQRRPVALQHRCPRRNRVLGVGGEPVLVTWSSSGSPACPSLPRRRSVTCPRHVRRTPPTGRQPEQSAAGDLMPTYRPVADGSHWPSAVRRRAPETTTC